MDLTSLNSSISSSSSMSEPVSSKASISAFRTLSKKLSAKCRKPDWHDTNDENVKCTKLPDHWRIKKSLGFKFQVSFHNNIVKDGCKVKISASNHKNANALIKNNESVVRNGIAEFNDLRFNSRSGRDTKFNVFIKVDSDPEVVFTYANAIKVTVDGPRPKRTYNKLKKNCDKNSVSRGMGDCAEYFKERLAAAAAAASSMSVTHDRVDALAAMRFSDELISQHQQQQLHKHLIHADEDNIDALTMSQRYIDGPAAAKIGLIDWKMNFIESKFKFSFQKQEEMKSLAPNLDILADATPLNTHHHLQHSISSPSSQSTSPNSNASYSSEYEVSNCSSIGATAASVSGGVISGGGRSAFSPFNKHLHSQLSSHQYHPYMNQQQQQLANYLQQNSQRDYMDSLSQLLQNRLYSQQQQQQQQQQALQLLKNQNHSFYMPSPSSSIDSLRNMQLDDNLFESSSSLSNSSSPLTNNSNNLVNQNTSMLMNRLLAKRNVLCAPHVLLPVNNNNNNNNQYYNLPYCIVPLLSNAYP